MALPQVESVRVPFGEVAGRLKTALESAPPSVVAAYLFGSVARGEAREGSDVDVAVLFSAPTEPILGNAANHLECDLERVLRRTVQVVELNKANADLVHRVLRDGVILLDRDRGARIEFEVRLRNEYFDLEPIRRMYRGTAS
ncbi:MAG TPA: nucleotidyltransferase domain-containing protein [Thermoanaerobaculia bacterium]|nr:nucleotidyltransferase domain-containing protein [Thermoanaerobaculia bacterium]